MGLWNKLFGGADGVRETVREAYFRHLNSWPSNDPDLTPHEVGLYGALSTRYMAGGRSKPEPMVWSELAPFVAMEANRGLNSLVEYVVWQEFPSHEVNVSWLSQSINYALEHEASYSQKELASYGFASGAPWSDLLNDKLRLSLRALTRMF